MNELKKLSLDAQIILGGTVLYVILSFFDWQQYCASYGGNSACAGQSEWHGIGVVAALFAVALLIWEINRVLKFAELPVDQALVSVGAAVTLLVLTVITFLSHNEFRHWPQWVALMISIVIVVVAVRRGREEGVAMPKMGSAAGSATGSGGGSSSSSTAGGTSAGMGGVGPSAAESGESGGESGGQSSTGMGDSGPSAAGGEQEGEKPPEA